jgi:hypothetical protein
VQGWQQQQQLQQQEQQQQQQLQQLQVQVQFRFPTRYALCSVVGVCTSAAALSSACLHLFQVLHLSPWLAP